MVVKEVMMQLRRGETLARRPAIAVFLCIFLFTGITVADATAPAKTGPAGPSTKATSTALSVPLLVDVGADKCIPCIMMAPILEELKKEYAGVLKVEFVDAWKNPEEARKYRVRGIPTQIFYDASGKELGRHMGFIDREGILRRFEQLGVPIRKPAVK